MSKASTRRRLAAINGVLSEAVPAPILKGIIEREAKATVASLPASSIGTANREYLTGLLVGFANAIVTKALALDEFGRS